MRRFAIFATSIASLAFGHHGFADEPVSQALKQAAPDEVVEVRLLPKASPVRRVVVQGAPAKVGGGEQPSADEAAIRATGDTYVQAFSKGDAKTAAAHFTDDGEYVDAHGTVYQGRAAIEQLLTQFFAKNPGIQIAMNIEGIRFVGPGVAIEDGTTTITMGKDSKAEPENFRYTAVHVKNGGKWHVASVRDQVPHNPRQHRAQLQQLSWMIGDWVHEGDDSIVHFTCKPTESGNFLIRDFNAHVSGGRTVSGTQRIGWDAQSGCFRAWVFDSDGGYSEGCWHRNGKDWVLKLSGVTADGQAASSTSIYAYVDARTMTFQSVDHEVGGNVLPNSEPVTIVRTSPQPHAGEGQ